MSKIKNFSNKNNIDYEELGQLNLNIELHAQLRLSGKAKASTLESANEALDKYRKNNISNNNE